MHASPHTTFLAAWLTYAGPDQTLQLFGINLVGLNAPNLTKLLLTVCGFAVVWIVVRGLRLGMEWLLRRHRTVEARFWTEQSLRLLSSALFLLLLISIWFNDPGRLATFLGMIGAGVAFAMQRVITAFCGYFLILRNRLFNIGDRIMIGGVRGDVVAVGYLRTTVMEMGQSPGEQADSPSVWVHSRQYTGRIVTVTNDKIFDEPVFNYTRDFPFLWEEMNLPVPFSADRTRAEAILLEAARNHTVDISTMSEEALEELRRRYFLEKAEVAPHVYWRLTDNWLELSLRFVAPARGIRALKDKMTREILTALDAAGIGIASTTYEITGLPPLRLERAPRRAGAS